MNTYIEAFSISIFFMSLCIIYAGWSIKKNKKNTILLSMIGTILLFKILYIIFSNNDINLIYIYEIITILFIIQMDIKSSENKIIKMLINTNFILSVTSFILSINNYSYKYNTVILVYLFITTMFINITKMCSTKLNKDSYIALSSIWIYLFIFPFMSQNKSIYFIKSILDVTISVCIFYKLYNLNIIHFNYSKKNIEHELNNTDMDLKKYNQKLINNKKMTGVINENIKKKENILRVIEDNYDKCVFIIDNQGYILNEDNSFCNIWNEYKEEKYKIKLSDFCKKSIKNSMEFINNINNVREKNIEIKGELKGKNGKIFSCNYVPFIFNNYNMGVICSIADITYKKNTELKIKDNDTKYRTIVNNIPYSILIKNEDSISYNNYKNNQIDFNNSSIKNMIIKTKTSGEINYNTLEGKQLYLNIDRINFKEDSKSKELVVIKDITKYKKLAQKLEYSKEKYETLVNIIPEGIYVYNYENKIINYSNQVFDNLIGKSNLGLIKPKDKIISLNQDNKNIKFKRANINNQDNENIDIEFAEMLIDVNKKPMVVGIVRDVTEQANSENIENKIEAKKKEHELKTEFFVNMSHELKTPLNVISSSNQLLEHMNKQYIIENPQSEINNSVEIVKKHTYMLMGLINNIIDLAKLESRYHDSNKDYYNIISIIEDVCEEFNKYIKVNDIEILFDTDEEERIANIDPDDVEKIVLTLLSSVVRYSKPKTTINVDLSSYKDKTNISIKNKGGYDYNRYINDQEKKALDIGMEVAKSIISLYKGNMDIKYNFSNDIEINIEIKTNDEIKLYKEREKINQERFIYTEYLRMCNF